MADVRYDFSASGMSGVLSAFDTIDRRAQRSAAVVERSESAKTTAARRGSAERERIERAPVSRAVLLARQVERDQIRAAQRQDREDKALVERKVTRRRQLLQSEIRSGELAGRAQARVDENMRRLRERHFAADQRRHEARVRAAQRAGEQSGRRMGAGASGGGSVIAEALSTPSLIKGGLGVAGGLANAALGAAAAGGAAFVGITAAAAKDAVKTQEIANRVSINSRGAGKRFVDADTLRKEFEATAASTPGQKASEIGEAVQAFVTKTGDLATARKLSGTFATVASASGGDVREIAGAGADIAEKLKITTVEGMQEAMGALMFQGKAGAFEISDAARLFPRMLAAASSLGVSQDIGGLRQVGGFAQIARSSTGGGEQATTAIENVFTTLKVKAQELEAAGVKVYEGKGAKKRMRSFTDIIADAVANVGGTDVAKKNAMLAKIFGQEGIRAINPLITTGMEAMNAVSGPDASGKLRKDAARGAVTERFNQAINSPGGWKEVQKDAAQAQTDVSAKLTAAWEKIVAVAGEKLLPVITDFAERLADTPDLLEDFKTVLEVLVLFAEDFGLIKRKGETAGEKRDIARKKAIKLYGEIDELGDISKMDSETRGTFLRKEAEYRIASEDARKYDALAKTYGDKDLTEQQIAERYLSLGVQGQTGSVAEDRKLYAAQLASQIYHGADTSMASSKSKQATGFTYGDLETDAQKEFRLTQSQLRRGVHEDTTGGLEEAAAALKEAAGLLKGNAGNRPTTVPAAS